MSRYLERAVTIAIGLLLLVSFAAAQKGRRHDPLSEKEVDQLREVADQPDERIKLYVKLARARMLAIEQTRSDPRFVDDRGARLHELIEDLGSLVDEIDDNVDQYRSHHNDVRKGLKELVEADSEFQLKLRTIKEQVAADPKLTREAADYKFVLEDTIESVNQSAESAREALEVQNQEFAKKKKGDQKK